MGPREESRDSLGNSGPLSNVDPSSSVGSSINVSYSENIPLTDSSINPTGDNSTHTKIRRFLWDWIKRFELPLENYHYGTTRCIIKDEMFQHPMTKETAIALSNLCGRGPDIDNFFACVGTYFDNYSQSERLGIFPLKNIKYLLGKGDSTKVSVFVTSKNHMHSLFSNIVVRYGDRYKELTFVGNLEINNFKTTKEIVAIGPNKYTDPTADFSTPKVLGVYDPLNRNHAWAQLGLKVSNCSEEDSNVIGKGILLMRDSYMDSGINNGYVSWDVEQIYGWDNTKYKFCHLGKEN